MKDFQDLLALALVGTSRGNLPQHAGTPLAETLNAVPGDPEGVLLSRAALAGLVRQAGQVAAPLTQEVPAPAPAETLPLPPQTFARHLPVVLNTNLLPEWLNLCAKGGWRVPPEYLPTLLDLARFDVEHRGLLRPVLGERGAWLAQFNPEWRFTPAAFSAGAWVNATEAQKGSLFESLRQSDPAASREFLTSQFKSERAGVRLRLLNVLQHTWAADDTVLEPLLEAALIDRSGDAQEYARHILQNLPDSAYNTRMTGRIAAMLHREKTGLIGKLLGKEKLTLELPEVLDADAKRDGVTLPDPKSKNPALTHFRTLLTRTHPAALTAALQLTPEQLVNTVKALDSWDQLRQAAQSTAHQATALALLPDDQNDIQLLHLAAPERIGTHLEYQLKKGEMDVNRLLDLLELLPTPWPAALSHELLSAVRQKLEHLTRNNYTYRWETVLQLAGQHADSGVVLPAPFPDEPENSEYYTRHLREKFNEMLSTLEQRSRLQRDFLEARG